MTRRRRWAQYGIGVVFMLMGVALLMDGIPLALGVDVRGGRLEVTECYVSGRAGNRCLGHVDRGDRRIDASYDEFILRGTAAGDSFDVIWRGDGEPVTVVRADDRIANPLVWPLAIVAFAGAVMLPFMQGWPRWLRRTNTWFTAGAGAAWLACLVATLS